MFNSGCLQLIFKGKQKKVFHLNIINWVDNGKGYPNCTFSNGTKPQDGSENPNRTIMDMENKLVFSTKPYSGTLSKIS